METTIIGYTGLYWGYITIIGYTGLYGGYIGNNGKENGNYYMIMGIILGLYREW